MLLPSFSEAATLSISGVAEGVQIVLPPMVSGTNLFITAAPAPGSPDVAFSLEAQGAVLQQVTSGPPYTVTFSNLTVGKYFLTASVATNASVSADVSFDVRSASLQPANDLWALGGLIASLPGIVVGTNTYASSETGEPMHTDNGSGRSLWWQWQAGSDGLVTVTTAGSGFDTVLGVYTGTNVAALTSVAANDDAGSTNRSSQVSFSAVAGTTYFLAVDGAVASDGSVSTGDVQLSLLAVAPPTVNFLAPTNGWAQVVPSPLGTTNVAVSLVVSDAVGIARVDYDLDGGGITRAGSLLPPYQWTANNLLAGDYLLSVCAVNTAGLITSEHVSFSVVSALPEIRFVDATPRVPAGFRFAVTGLKGMKYELQAATNIPAWGQLVLWTNFDGALRVTDTNAAQFSTRFYRVVAP